MQKNLLIATCAVLALSACSSTGTLKSPQTDAKISGTVTRGLIEPYRVEVSLEGKSYRGEWRTSDPTKELRASTGFPHQKHIGQVRAVLAADDGSKLECRWNTHGDTAEGSCKAGNRDYALTLN